MNGADAEVKLLLDKAQSFTGREITTLQEWLIAANANLLGTASRILSTGLLAEHFESLLPEDPTARTQAMTDALAVLRTDADAAVASLTSTPGYPFAGP